MSISRRRFIVSSAAFIGAARIGASSLLAWLEQRDTVSIAHTAPS